jgi:acetyl-CoA carboxylase biotin carboxyl carrier protein
LTHDTLTYDDLLRIVELIKSSEQFSEFRLKIGDVEIELRRRQHASAPAAVAPPVAVPVPAPTPMPANSPTGAAATATQPATPKDPSSALSTPTWPAGSMVVRAPMVGTFYRAPEPGAPPFVEIGQAVESDTTVCIIEVMKLMNSIPAGARGVVTHVLAENGAPVETNAPLVVVDPAPASR